MLRVITIRNKIMGEKNKNNNIKKKYIYNIYIKKEIKKKRKKKRDISKDDCINERVASVIVSIVERFGR